MEVKKWTYEEYPEFHDENIDGIIDTTGDEPGVHYYPDVVYAEIDGTELHLQIMVPYSRNTPEGTEKYPCFVYVQGSAWGKQDVHAGVPLVARYAEKGYVSVIVEYRHSGIAPFPACITDAKNAVRFLRKNADQYSIDPQRIIMAGSSSGGHTAVYSGILKTDDTKNNLYPGITAKTAGIVDYYGSVSVMADDANPTTLDHCLPTSPEGREMGNINLRENPEKRRLLSCECNITEDTDIPPVIIFHGTKDRTVNPSGSKALYEQLKKTGHEAYFYLVKGADHGRAEFFKPEVIDITDAFMKKCFEKSQ